TNNFTSYGAYISSSPYNLILNNTIYNVTEAIYLSDSENNKVANNIIRNAISKGIEVAFSSTENIIDKNFIYNSTGIIIFCSSNNIISNNTIRDIRRGYFPMSPPEGAAGIWLGGSGTTNNYFFNNTITGSNETCDVYGIFLRDGSNNNVFDHIQIGDLNSTGSVYGIYIYMHYLGSNNNIFSNCSIYGMDGDNAYAFYSTENNKNNTIKNMTIASYPTTISFTYGNGIALKGVEGDIPWNNGLAYISKFVNITNITDSSWINITFYYSEEDVSIVDETTLALYEWDGSNWNEMASIHDMENNTINANITEFSIYGIFGTLDMTIKFNLGWNLITIPTDTDWTAHDLGTNISGCTLVVKWDASLQKYVAHYVPWETVNNFDIKQ
ncbi:MAG: hypothetical protein DRN11_01780, partial [Thermoplasmata archaeon]